MADTLNVTFEPATIENNNNDNKRVFNTIANPSKVKSTHVVPDLPMNGNDDDDLDEFSMDDIMNTINNGFPQDNNNEEMNEYMMEPPEPQNEEEQKKELLRRLYYQQQYNGEKLSKRLTMNNSLDEIQQVYGNLMHAKKARTSIKFYKQIYYFLIWGIEKTSQTLGKGKIRLNGWKDSMEANLDSYDPIFEEIYYQHEDVLGSMDPLIKLAIMTVASAFVYHINAPEEQTDETLIDTLLDKLEQNPVLMDKFAMRFKNQIFHAPDVAPPPDPIYNNFAPRAPSPNLMPEPEFSRGPPIPGEGVRLTSDQPERFSENAPINISGFQTTFNEPEQEIKTINLKVDEKKTKARTRKSTPKKKITKTKVIKESTPKEDLFEI